MPLKRATLASAIALSVLAAAPAGATVAHTVAPGETLWSIAAANNLTTRTVAAHNGISETSSVVTGTTIQVPSVAEGEQALAGGGSADAGGPPSAGAYTVLEGDTLTGVAAQAGVTPDALAAVNGLDPDAQILSGTVIELPGESSAAPTSPSPSSSSEAAPTQVTAAEIGEIASSHGVPASLAAAVAWQESGFNNSVVSSADARGVMQVLPGTWSWVEQYLHGGPLDPDSATDNVHAGSLYLAEMLRNAGGDPALALAGYYQGESSVRSIGMLPETRLYVDNVLALRDRFGGR